MDLGRVVVGPHREGHPVPRTDTWYRPLGALLAACELDGYGCIDTEDGKPAVDLAAIGLEINPYSWDGCACEYDAAADAWHEANQHSHDCYQTRLHAAVAEYDRAIGYEQPTSVFDDVTTEIIPKSGGVVFVTHPRADREERRRVYRMHEAFVRKTIDALCAEHGLNPRFGGAVHCTCDHRQRWEAFSETHGHRARCPCELPNLWHHPSGFQLRWYKYPLRGARMNLPWTLREWRAFFRERLREVRAIRAGGSRA